MPLTPVTYKDLPVRIILALTGAFIFTVYGEKENSLELLLLPEFYPAFLTSLVIALVVIHYIYFANTVLNVKYDWQGATVQRLLLQLLFALIVPSLLAFSMATIYFRYNKVDLRNTFYITHEFPFIVLLLTLLNAYYIGYYFLVKWQRAHRQLLSMESSVLQDRKDILIVSRGNKNLPITISEISCVFRENEANFLQMIDGERYFLTGTLDDVFQRLDGCSFFRVNRQLIINRKILLGYKNDINGKIALELSVKVPEPPIVSQKRAKGFREWVGNF